MATYSSVLVGKIPWTEEPGGLQFMGSRRVGHDLGTKPPPLPRDFTLVSVCFFGFGLEDTE